MFDGSLERLDQLQREWLEDTTWDGLPLTYETNMLAQNFDNISLHISK